MSVVGIPTNVSKADALRQYEKHPLRPMAEEFLDIAKSSIAEGADVFAEPSRFFSKDVLTSKLQKYFVENTFDPKDPEFEDKRAVAEHYKMLSNQFANDVACVTEAAPLSAFNPVVGLTFPMHKNLLMTTVFDKGAIPKDVSVAPSFTLTMETRTMYAPNGMEIDMFLEQNKIKDLIRSSIPRRSVVLTLPEDFKTDVLGLLGAVNRTTANISRSSVVTKIIVDGVYVAEGEEYLDTDGVIKTVASGGEGVKQAVIEIRPIRFVATYGQFDRTFNNRIDLIVPTNSSGEVKELRFQLTGAMHRNMFSFAATHEDIKGLVLDASLDVSSAAYETPKVKWSARTDFFEIPEAPHITVTVAPEEVRDVNAMYNVNQLTKLMSMIKLALVNYKDDCILENLDQSFLNLPTTSKVTGTFDFVPREGYLASHVAWRYETFMDYLDTQVTSMLQVLNDENMTISVFGRPELIRKISPTEYKYTTPTSIGPVMLDYKKTVVTSDNRVYQFISSNKLRNDNNLIIILCPRNSTRIIYKIFDYQLYVGNEIRDTNNYQLPALTAFERFLFVEYQPVQGRIQILNPTGLKTDVENNAPVNPNRALNDYTANKPSYLDGKYVDHETALPGTARAAINPTSVAANEYAYGSQTAPFAIEPPNYATSDPKNPN